MSMRSKMRNAGWVMPNGVMRTARRAGRSALWLWHLLVRNRVAIAIASLVWLIYRSGTQPRRITYPCQQVAAVNVGVFAAGLIPALFLARKRRCSHAVPRRVMVRRQLLIAGIMFVVALIGIESYQFAGSLIPPQLPETPPAPLGDPTPTFVGICEQAPSGGSYTQAEIQSMVNQAIASAGGLDDVIDTGDTVVIKPNLVQTKWDATQGVVTDPRVCKAVVTAVKNVLGGTGEVIIAEGTADGDGGRGCTWHAFHNAGYDTNWDHKFDLDISVDLFDLNDSGGLDQHDPGKVTLVTIPNGVIRTQYYVPNILLDCDVLISMPTFKNHFNGTITLSMKNRVGCPPNDIYHYPGLEQMKWALVHSCSDGFPCTVPPTPSDENERVQRTLVDLNLVRPHDFAVVDALQGITNGPNNDPPEHPSPHMQMIIAGREALSVDTVGALCMGYDPEYVTQISYADSTGSLGTKDTRYITVLGDHVASVRYNFPEGYAGSVRADSTPPSISDISLTNGQQVTGTVTISGSGIVGAVKAELAIDGDYLETDRTSPYSFEWDSTTVSEGWHTVTFTVYDAALNEASISRSVEVVHPEPIPGDFNGDRDVDQEDREHMTDCMAGPGVPPSGECTDTDLDGDTDADQEDFGLFQRCLTGPDEEGDPNCAD